MAPAKVSDYAFVLDGLSRLSEKGQAFYILPVGVLFRGGAEGKIRKQLIENNLIDTVISLPEKLFLNTQIPVNILVFNKAKQNDDILFIYADELFKKSGKKNVMTDEHIEKIADVYWNRKNVDGFSRVVELSEIKENDYCLNVNRFVYTDKREELPPLRELIKDTIKADLKIRKSTQELLKMLQELCGDDDFNELKDEFIEYFNKQDVVGETMLNWFQLKNIEYRTNYIATHAKKERIPIFDIATFERVKKGKIYEAGTVYIQLSATDGKVRYLTENKELETKYGVFIPKSEYIGTRYLYYMLLQEMETFFERYQNGININQDIFKYLKVTYHPEVKYQKELVMMLDMF